MALKGLQERLDKMTRESKETRTFSNDLKQHSAKPKYDNIRVQSEDKAKAINYYDNLSESDKLAFQKEGIIM